MQRASQERGCQGAEEAQKRKDTHHCHRRLRKNGACRGRHCYTRPQVEHVVGRFHRLWQHNHRQERDQQEEQVDNKHEPRRGGAS